MFLLTKHLAGLPHERVQVLLVPREETMEIRGVRKVPHLEKLMREAKNIAYGQYYPPELAFEIFELEFSTGQLWQRGRGKINGATVEWTWM
jgi:hypothetical protein